MRAVYVESAGVDSSGKPVVRAIVVSNSAPDELPMTGENVFGMTAEQTFAPLSLLLVIGAADTKVFIADEQGIFVPQ